MNARQKAKKYKKKAEEYSDAITLLKTELKLERFSRCLELEKQKNIVPLKMAAILPDYMPEDMATLETKRIITLKLSEFLIDNDLIIFDIDKVPMYGEFELVPKLTAYLEVAIPKRHNYLNERGAN